MNDIVKKNIQEKLMKAMDEESLKPGQVAKFLNLIPSYISMIKKETQWEKCPRTAWEKVLVWVNTGTSMKAYSEKRAETKIEAEKITSNLGNEIKTQPEKSKENTEYEIKIVRTKSDLIAILREERSLLEKKVIAIDVLLKYYSDKE